MTRWRRRAWLPWLAGVAALALTAVAAFYAATATIARERLQFETIVRHAETEVSQRLAAHVAMLRAGAGLFAASGDVNRAEFHAYVERLDLPRVYPGIQGIGYSVRVDAAEREPLARRMRAEGFEDFRVWPEHERNEYHAIIYLEPLDRRNRAAIGYDMFTEPIRRAAMTLARDSGQPAATGRVTLVQEIDERKQAGFLIYVPVYRGGAVPDTVAERRAKLVGYVYSPFRAADLLEATVAGDARASVTLAVYDGEGPSGDGLLYQSATPMPGAVTMNRSLVVAGRPWALQFAARPTSDDLSAQTLALLVLVSGLLFSALLAGALYGELRA
jgi:CHASE1-domain containing sensor protein